ncbi:Soluble starch synthase 3, chloroplastic/amyloplastic [Vitis vinifera]|uniref:starch synthase n=1 Tax=Vitis vinifera TaxID=29760 RepID=A0A438EEJ5_VITVI|nr:Soluble starch synthase 3, chloroplastic/amyloplastic [Vitis vinifera]
MGTPENVVRRNFISLLLFSFLCYCFQISFVLILSQVERTARMKAEAKERTLKMFLLSQKHIVYTEPLDVQAGSTVSVLYNPANTVLNGKSEVWFRCSFNRWTHRNGSLPPQKMLPVDNGSHLKATGKFFS